MRQFGMRQLAPPPAPISEDVWRALHHPRETTAGKDWGITRADYVFEAGQADPPLAEPDRQMDVAPV